MRLGRHSVPSQSALLDGGHPLPLEGLVQPPVAPAWIVVAADVAQHDSGRLLGMNRMAMSVDFGNAVDLECERPRGVEGPLEPLW